jgi:hypothetical protein
VVAAAAAEWAECTDREAKIGDCGTQAPIGFGPAGSALPAGFFMGFFSWSRGPGSGRPEALQRRVNDISITICTGTGLPSSMPGLKRHFLIVATAS